MGSFPALSLLITTTGRVFCISAPTVGSRLISQTSPLFGRGLVLNEVPPSHVFQCPVVLFQMFGLVLQNLFPLCGRKLHERPSVNEILMS